MCMAGGSCVVVLDRTCYPRRRAVAVCAGQASDTCPLHLGLTPAAEAPLMYLTYPLAFVVPVELRNLHGMLRHRLPASARLY